jgi:sugar phosphate permease
MEKKQKPITIGYAWYALFIMFMINMFNYLDRLSIGPAMEHIKRYFAVTDTKMGWILGAFTLVYAIVSLPMGFLSDRGKRTFFVGLGALVWSISTTLSGFSKSFYGFFGARAAVGSGEGIYAPTGSAIIADYFPRNRRATAISIFMSAMLIGGALALIVAGMILSKTDKFDLKRMANLLPYKQGEGVGGWKYDGLHQTPKRLVSYDFKQGSDILSVVLSKPDLKKKADAYSALFNIDFRLNEKAELAGEQKQFAESVVKTIQNHEDDPLNSVSASMERLPSHFKLPEEYKGLLIYDKEAKKLTYKGIMTLKDKKALRDISDNPDYQKTLISIYNYSTFYYRRSDNWKWIFWILGPPGLLFALLAFMLREPVKGGTEEYLTEEQAIAIQAQGKIDYSPLWKTPSLIIMMLSNVVFTAGVGGLNMWLFPFIERYKDMESATAAMKIGPIVVVAMLFGVILSGIVADKMFKKNQRAYNIIIFICILLSVPFMYVFILTLNYYALIASVSIGMFLLAWVNGPQNTLLVSVVDPKLRATMNAIHILLIHVLGDGPSPIIIGYLSDKYSLKNAFLLLPIALLIGGIGFLIAGYFVPRDLERLERRMKGQIS